MQISTFERRGHGPLSDHRCRNLLFCCLLLLFIPANPLQFDSDLSWEQPHHTAKLRHSRHSGQNSGRSSHEVSSRFSIKDNHKPVFTNCSQYHPSIKEEMDPGFHFLTVTAVDQDPVDKGGTVKYQFVSSSGEKNKFTIDSETGEIRTLHKFDRDEPAREKEAYITVRATDNGIPELDDVCTIKITIDDINDNMPVFDKVSYSESIPQDLLVSKEAMRISATDIDDGNNSIVEYEIDKQSPDYNYFQIDRNTGVISLKQKIDKEPRYQFKLSAIVNDKGEDPKTNSIKLDIRVVESNKKSPSFVEFPTSPIYLKESFSDFDAHIATLQAVSHIPDEGELLFELVNGQTEQTNKRSTFVMESEGDMAYIKLGNHLDYEKITDYTLAVRVQNKYNLAAEITVHVKVEDVNDNIPVFAELTTGSVLENEPAGTPVMQVRAFDADGTSAHNQVTYELADHKDLFEIDSITGNITTKTVFDREQKDFYNVKVIASDNSESALIPGKNNTGQQVFRIEIADKNDNKPHFTQTRYVAEAISEAANVNQIVTEVKAIDNDTASQLEYTIVDGNTYDAFLIENKTGKIRVKNKLDYENITEYLLSIKAYDGEFEDVATVKIIIDNINDNPPKFEIPANVTIQEETMMSGCIAKVEAYDPDIPNRKADQKIVYNLVKEDQRNLMSIDNEGCIKLIKPLNRDPPNGFSTWQVLVSAQDEYGSPNCLRSTAEVIIILIDINDNAPFLSNPQPVIWYENEPPGLIENLTAKDYDSETNGAPFTFAFDITASQELRRKFEIHDHGLYARVTFDREETKEYFLPIAITDSGIEPMTGVSILHVVIGDRNDNAMSEGHSEISVYNYMSEFEENELDFVHNGWLYGYGETPESEIGRVYVTDPDDWDLPDKQFFWLPSFEERNPFFEIQRESGMIIMKSGTPDGSYFLRFNVTEHNPISIPFHWVEATVNVTIKRISAEAVNKSGSIRFINTTAEEFITPQHGGLSKKDILQQQIALIMNTSLENVDVFTVFSTKPINDTHLDVRFSAHGSPYYAPENMNSKMSNKLEEIEALLDMKIQMVGIDECLFEKGVCPESCRNILDVTKFPLSVFTNKTSFVGVWAKVEPRCTCSSTIFDKPIFCLNGGTFFSDRCECPVGFTGPRCELTSVGFHGDGYAIYPTIPSCNESRVSLSISPQKESGLIFYVGPLRKNNLLNVQDFMSLELIDGYLVLLVDYGSGTARVEHKHNRIALDESHFIEIMLSRTGIEMFVDYCRMSSCMNLAAPNGQNEFLNVNGPLQLGGSNINLKSLGDSMGWKHIPSDIGFVGCISNFTFNMETYNLGLPSDSKHMDITCSTTMAKAVSFGIAPNFLVALLVCITVLLLLLLTVVVLRRKQVGWAEKEFDDIRENIINYQDEGGGEGDAAYDLHVLRQNYEPPEKERDKHQTYAPAMPDTLMHADISGFLDEKKHSLDRDPDNNPFDDVRHYAYEGDGNSTGSLSSLASCTDEGDLKFNYLSSFGPRFRKLADMYGEVPSDEDESQAPGEESWC